MMSTPLGAVTRPRTRPLFASRVTPFPSAHPTKTNPRSGSIARPREPSQPLSHFATVPRSVDDERLGTALDLEEVVVDRLRRIALESENLDAVLVGLGNPDLARRLDVADVV